MEYFHEYWTRIVLSLSVLLLGYLPIRSIVVTEFLRSVLQEDAKKYYEARGRGENPGYPFARHDSLNFFKMLFEFWVWPLSRYLPKEEKDESNTVSG